MKPACLRYLLPALVLPVPALAQDVLNPLLVTASRSEHPLDDAPYTASVIDEKAIEENTRRTLPDSLQFVPGVLVQKTAYGHGSPYIRGFTGRQNLLMIDGVRFNNSVFRSGPVQYWNTIDLFSIDRLELIKSQGSVLYGSDAVGGTLNVLTRNSGFENEKDGQFYSHGSAYYEYRTNGEGSHIGHIESNTGVGGKWGLHLGLSAKDFGDIEDEGVGRMKNTGYPEQNLDLRFDALLSAGTTLTLAHQQTNQDDVWRWHSTIYNPGWEHGDHVAAPGTWTSRVLDQERSLTYIRVAQENPEKNSFISRWHSTLSYQTTTDSETQDRRPDPTAGSRPIRFQSADIDTTGLDLGFESPLGQGTLVYGLDYYQDRVNSEGYQTNAAHSNTRESLPVADDSNYHLFGSYAQYVWKPNERFELTGGGRYTYARAELGRFYNTSNVLQRDEDQDWDALVGSLRALYRFDEQNSVYGGLSQAFRAPNLDDLSGNLTARSGNTSLGSVDVDSERYLTYELGARHTRKDLALNAAVFYTDIDDIITGVPISNGSSTTIATNGRDGYVYGIELEGVWNFQQDWTLSGFAAWQDGKTEAPAYLGGPVNDEAGSRMLPLTGSLALRWTAPSKLYWIEGRVLTTATADRLSASDKTDTQRIPTNGTPHYTVAMLHAGWTPNEHLEFTCGLENLSDVDYRIHGSGQNEPGFNAILGAKVIW